MSLPDNYISKEKAARLADERFNNKVIQAMKRFYSQELEKQGFDSSAIEECPIDDSEVRSFIEYIKSDPAIGFGKKGAETEGCFALFKAVFHAGVAASYIYADDDPSEADLRACLLEEFEKAGTRIVDGNVYFCMQLLDADTRAAREYSAQTIDALYNEIKKPFEGFCKYTDNQKKTSISAVMDICSTAFAIGYDYGEFLAANYDDEDEEEPEQAPEPEDDSEGYYFENMMELALYGQKAGKGKKVIWLSGDDYLDRYKKGYALFEQKQYQQALSVYKECLSLNPVGISARFEICECYLALRDYQKAKNALLEMKDYLYARGLAAKFYRRFGYILAEEGAYSESAACYKFSQSYEKHPSVPNELKYLKSKGGARALRGDPQMILESAGIPIIKIG